MTAIASSTHRVTPLARPTRDRGTRPNGGHVGLVALVAWTELRSSAHSAEFAVGAVGIPVLLYMMFGLPNPNQLDGGTTIRTAMLVSLSAYGIVSLAIFSFGENVARSAAADGPAPCGPPRCRPASTSSARPSPPSPTPR